MRRLGICALLVSALAAMLAAQSHAPAPAAAPPPMAAHGSSAAPVQTFSTYCVECHGQDKPKAGISVERLLGQLSLPEIGEQGELWENVAEMLESGEMPPKDAKRFPTDEEREAAATWVRSSLADYQSKHAGEPGRVTVRRLTSAEYAYAIRDLTDVDIPVGIDASSEAVGGEGFANFGDVQFVHDATVERYLEAARLVADHAIIGAGPLAFYADAGKTGLELSALRRIQQLYQARGFRVVSGEGGRPFGFDRYSKAMLVAWRFKHRAALGAPQSTLRGLAADEGITGRFAEHIWDVMNRTATGYPVRLTVERWQALAAPDADAAGSVAKARAECDQIVKQLVSWPSWFFARGDLAAGGAGDESPLVFDDTTLGVEPRHSYVYQLNRRLGPKAPAPPPGPWTVHVTTDALHDTPGATPVVIWRNPRIVVRQGRIIPPDATAAQLRAMPPAPVLSTHALREVVAAEDVAALAFGTAPGGTTLGPDDFAVAKAVKFAVNVPAEGKSVELQADVELAGDPNAVVRVFIGSRPDQSARDPGQRVFLGNPSSAGYRTFRTGIAEYVALLPPNSHGEANPADKDPVPAPFDNTYNSPEHDAFVTKVKYQRTDDFFTRHIVDGEERAELEAAWNDLFGSWPYHDAYLGMLWDHYGVGGASRRIVDMTPPRIARLPAAVRPHVRALRAHYDQVSRAMKGGERRHVADALAMASMAWRRPLSDAERANLQAFYDRLRATERLDHDAATRALIARILVSPAFLYRLETAPRGSEQPLNSWEIASRLSFFLWSSIPDAELHRAATAGTLNDPAALAAQVRRMTGDPKARRLATEFFGQWLGFYHFDEHRGVDTGRFPEFTNDVKTAMYDEAISSFEYMIRQSRPVSDILHADYTFLNTTLARFYGLEGRVKVTDTLQKVDNARALDRGGALRLGSVLTATSAPLRTSPVKRGDWVLRRILGTPTPPPPADAGNIAADDKTFGGLTLREKLAQHKRNAACAACHARVDPLGFPLEGYDAIGRVRRTYADGKPVDVTGELRDSTTIVGADGLLDYLRRQDRKVMTTLSRKMIGYALGRNSRASDRQLLDAMVRGGSTQSFSDLAVTLVTSRQFRNRAGAIEPAGSPATPTARTDSQ